MGHVSEGNGDIRVELSNFLRAYLNVEGHNEFNWRSKGGVMNFNVV